MSEQDSYLITHICDLLHFLEKHHLSVEEMMAPGSREKLQSLSDRQELHTAYEVIKFIDGIPGGFFIYYADGGEEIIYANRALLRIFQCGAMEEFRVLTGNSFRGVVHPDDLEEVEKSIQAQIAASQYDLDYVEYRIIRKDGAIRWIEDYGHFVQSSRSFFYVFLGDATEKWEHRLAERAVINQEYLRRLEVIEGLSINYESIFYVDLDQNQILPYRLSSRSAPLFDGQFHACRLDAVMSGYSNNWVHPEDRQIFNQATTPDYIRKKLAASKTYYLNYRVQSGHEIQYMQMRAVNVGRRLLPAQVVMGYRRMDDELQQELEQKQLLAQALENAKRAMDAKNTFLSNMSHDMRTPLNAILGYTTLAKRDREDPEAVRNYLERIETAGHQLLDLINKVLELSQAESSVPDLIEKECDLCQSIQTVYDFLAPQAAEKGIDFSLDCSDVRHRKVYSDPEKLEQLLMYLSNNAITYTGTGGRVAITATEGDLLYNQYGVYQLVVEDNGIGISEKFLEQIFEPFSRERNTTLGGIHGIGLGLTITRNLVDMMGGSIDVKSAEGKGSTFTVTLHLRVKPNDSARAALSVELPKVQRILLVEDNEINREIETAILEGLGFTIETAEDGSIGVEKLKKSASNWYDLILMDIQMPVMNGWESAEAIRKLPDPRLANVPIIALSANSFDSDVKKSIESGIDAHLSKPLDVPLLLRTIDEVAKKRAAG